MRPFIQKLLSVMLLSSCLMLVACASGPQIQTDYDHSADFATYKTFAFAQPLGTDRAGYTSIVTSRLKEATNMQMMQRGYIYQEQNPDLLVNFFIKVSSETEYVPPPPMWGGYYGGGFGGGFYQPWGYGGYGGFGPTTVQFTEGSLKVDLIDARKKQLVWEGTASNQIDDSNNPTSAKNLSLTVAQIFAYYPFAAVPATPPVVVPAK